MYPSGRVRCLIMVFTSSSTTQVKLRQRVDHGCTWWWDQGTRSRYPGNHSARDTRVGAKRLYPTGGSKASSASRVLLVMRTNPSDSLDASPKRSTFETRRFANGADPLEVGESRLRNGGIYWKWGRHRSGRRRSFARRSTASQRSAPSRQSGIVYRSPSWKVRTMQGP